MCVTVFAFFTYLLTLLTISASLRCSLVDFMLKVAFLGSVRTQDGHAVGSLERF